jgi:hypothetical protein
MFKCGSKLMVQADDGATVMNDRLNGLQTKILEKYPKDLFARC